VQNYGIIPDFDLFLHGKNGGPSPRAVDRARVVGPRLTREQDRAARSPERGWPALQSPRAPRGLGKKERSSGGCSPRASVADSTARRGEAGGGEAR
jgi:hypothetical protein